MTAWVSCARAALICGRRVCACLLQRCLACVTAALGFAPVGRVSLCDCRRRCGRFGCVTAPCARCLQVLPPVVVVGWVIGRVRIVVLCGFPLQNCLVVQLVWFGVRLVHSSRAVVIVRWHIAFRRLLGLFHPPAVAAIGGLGPLGQSSVLLAACTSCTAAWRCSRPLAFGGSCAVSPPFESLLPACCLACCDCCCAPVECQLVFRGVAPEVSADGLGGL